LQRTNLRRPRQVDGKALANNPGNLREKTSAGEPGCSWRNAWSVMRICIPDRLSPIHWRSAPHATRARVSVAPATLNANRITLIPEAASECTEAAIAWLSNMPVSPFVLLVPGTTREHADGFATALPQLRRANIRSVLLRPHSHTAAFEIPRRPSPGTGNQPDCHSASCVSPTRRHQGHVARGEYPSGTKVVCPASRHGILSERNRCVRFLRPEYRSCLIPTDLELSPSNNASHRSNISASSP